MDPVAQVLADNRVLLGNPGDGTPDRFAHRDPRALRIVGEPAGAVANAARGGQRREQPIAFGASFGGASGSSLASFVATRSYRVTIRLATQYIS